MWLCLNDAFISIVDKAAKQDHLVVRARRSGDIGRAFPGVKETRTPGNDYLFRAEVPRRQVADAIAARVMNIDYHNFKDSTHDDRLHSAYMAVWSAMGRLQPGGPYGQANRNRGQHHLGF